MNKQVVMMGALAAVAGLASAQEVVKIGHAAAVTGPVAYFEDRDRRIGPIFQFTVSGKF